MNTDTHPETPRAIIAEMRASPKSDETVYITSRLSDDETHYEIKHNTLRSIADRLEAALAREAASAGNAAAMREALEAARGILVYIVCADDGTIVQAIDAALSAPARNCDRTKDAAEETFEKQFGRPWNVEEDELATWLFAKAEGASK